MWHSGNRIHLNNSWAESRETKIILVGGRFEPEERVCASLRIELQHQGAASKLAACLDVGKLREIAHHVGSLPAGLGCAKLVCAFLVSVYAYKRDGARESILVRQKRAIDGVLSRRCPAYIRHTKMVLYATMRDVMILSTQKRHVCGISDVLMTCVSVDTYIHRSSLHYVLLCGCVCVFVAHMHALLTVTCTETR